MKNKNKTLVKKESKNIFRRIVDYVKPHKAYFFISVILTILAVVFSLVNPILIGKAIDHIISANNVNFVGLGRMLVILAIFSVSSAYFEWMAEYTISILSYKTAETLRQDLFAKFNKVPLKYIDRTAHGDLMNAMIIDTENITTGFLEGFHTLLSGIVTILSALVFMFIMNIATTLVILAITPLSLLIAIFISKSSKKLFKEQVSTMAKVSAFTEEMFSNQKTIKAFCYEDNAQQRFDNISDDLYACTEKATFISSMANPATRFVNGLIYGITGLFSAFMALNGRVTIGQISSFLNYSQQFTKPFNEITSVIVDIQVAFASARRVFKILDENNEIDDSKNEELKKCDGSVKIQNVNFSYEPEFKLIEGLNLDVKRGEKIAIVGPTGCGKSTIINLLMRFYDVNSGQILLSKKDIKTLTRASVRLKYGMVLQESWLFNGSIKDNIAYSKPESTFDEIVNAAKMANAHQFIERMPNGYDSVITEQADNISLGQKQLICIARIMLTNPPMLILDEATSSIDTRTEQKIQETFNKIMEGRTSFVVAHRLSTIMNADQILVMNNGQVIEQGNHNELMKKGGFYSELFNSQFVVY
ncbi:MAG: ABC transporter ATP-binding protein [Clostridia bacterium]|nr:ABC transporter ATP-binding protein [Clostridia bacterium]